MWTQERKCMNSNSGKRDFDVEKEGPELAL